MWTRVGICLKDPAQGQDITVAIGASYRSGDSTPPPFTQADMDERPTLENGRRTRRTQR